MSYAVEVTTTSRAGDTRAREWFDTEPVAVALALEWAGPDTPLVTVTRFDDDALAFASATWHPTRGKRFSAWRVHPHESLPAPRGAVSAVA